MAIGLIRSVNSTEDSEEILEIDGYSLSISNLIKITHLSSPTKASDRVQVQMTKSEETLENINSSLEFMLARTGKSTYGVTTGFGAAATTRTDRVKELQVSIVEHLLAGATGFEIDESNQQIVPSPDLNIQSITQPIGPMVMSESIVRGAILIRLNSLSR
ncbi:L-Aspartase-like protein [Phakopsora pachyrhizi]|uniref:L-Aspartase-like protein n=1 Tax=Phakopsora pachyrhizi TaxID=170000 RepID=A0AAV0AH34_PHAPC|nr:L-Aspartase-like protein [Phakopsora pachyrhizi]